MPGMVQDNWDLRGKIIWYTPHNTPQGRIQGGGVQGVRTPPPFFWSGPPLFSIGPH